MKPHGHNTIETSDQMLLVDATGPFNDEVIRDYLQDLRSSFEALASGPWRLLGVFHDESLFTPEAEAELIRVTHWRKSMGLTTVALAFINIVGGIILADQLTRIYQAADIEHAFFDTTENAMQWLQERGFAANLSSG